MAIAELQRSVLGYISDTTRLLDSAGGSASGLGTEYLAAAQIKAMLAQTYALMIIGEHLGEIVEAAKKEP